MGFCQLKKHHRRRQLLRLRPEDRVDIPDHWSPHLQTGNSLKSLQSLSAAVSGTS
eukprot:m.47042 g.47042  ORF g.47042 m.47042 type:complete len:55 (-) comp8820_c0_seq1:428-592(-)